MMYKQDELAEKMTLCINRAGTLEDSLKEAYDFLAEIFPLEYMTVSTHNTERGRLRYLAQVTHDGAVIIDESIQLSHEARKAGRRNESKKIIYYDQDSPLSRDVAAHLQFNESKKWSVISQVLNENQPEILAVGLIAFGENRYNQTHERSFELLAGPLLLLVQNVLSRLEAENRNQHLSAANRELRKRLGYLTDGRVIGAESGLREVMSMALKVAPLDSPVLLLGETGSGKEVAANAIHRASGRSEEAFISVNCGAIPDSLMDSQLFGHEKGAFTGALDVKRGYFEQADGGTIFLDEIGELTLQAQVRLLRILQSMEFQRVGGSRFINVDVRVIAATNRDLPSMVKEGAFRNDLWFRLNVFPIQLPSLRQRKEDLPALAQYFAQAKVKEMNLPYQPVFAPGAMEQLAAYNWPGNVRELQNVIERKLILSHGEPLSFPGLGSTSRRQQPEEKPETSHDAFPRLDQVVVDHIGTALELTGGKINGPGGAAELLGLNPSTLRGKMRKLGITLTRKPNLS